MAYSRRRHPPDVENVGSGVKSAVLTAYPTLPVFPPGADIVRAGRHVSKVPSPDEQITANDRSWAPTGLPLDNLVSYLGVDGMAEEWWSTISQRSPFLT
jgi:hypothetical protein